ncbi:hypothetical protein [Rhodopirellula sp. P2]|uniref:hypothetical protein n=1 Tax=Rhodopirellula sp. P2 TaxID=2127060 RepID=UPI0023676400|nr:hypothetical protein [Rhodopirellula sp. P2]WDQ16186.1 hypothetical protein PSR62_21525 [Rhodopirellula sp. P2]
MRMKNGNRLQWFGIAVFVLGLLLLLMHAWQRQQLGNARERVRDRMDVLEAFVAQADSNTMTAQETHQLGSQLDSISSDLLALGRESDSPWSAMNVSFMSYIACSLIGSVLTIVGSSRLPRSRKPTVKGPQDD